jgi:hypothetical protein
MTRLLMRLLLALAFIGTGWGLARAQRPDPDFILSIDAPGGATTVRCVRGCKLVWSERGVNPNATPISSFEYNCTGGARCVSGQVAGWVDR